MFGHNLSERLSCLLLGCLAAVFTAVAQAESDMVEPPHVPVVVEQPEAPLSESMVMESLTAGVNDIAVLFLYTPDTVRHYGSVAAVTNRINQLVNSSNTAYSNSGVNLDMVKAGEQLVQYDNNNSSATAFAHLSNKTHIAFADVNALRMQTQADFVVLLRPYKSDGYCGKAYFLGDISNPGNNYWVLGGYAYAHVSINCSNYVLAHELGHLMGLAHSRAAIGEPAAGKAYAYGAGYGVHNDFVTVMATGMANASTLYGTYNALARFSTPAQTCTGRSGVAKPCGVDSTQSNGADAVLAINNVAAQLPKFSDDSDDDGMPDWFEYFWGLNRFNAADAALDADGDGLSNLNEFYTESYAKVISGVSLTQARDTDGDGLLDGADPFPTIVGTPLFNLNGLFSGSGLRESVQP